MILEVAGFNYQSAILAQQAGADRLELCENAAEGGTTPSYGTLKLVKEKISIPVFPIIRPRGGDFLYSDNEFEIMKQDIGVCKELGYEGIVIGLLNADGTVDKKRTAALVELATPMQVTFHRAFDRTAVAFLALEDIIECGCKRILTSGQYPDAMHGKKTIKKLVEQADGRIIIMPGSGVRAENIKELKEFTGAIEFHSSARSLSPSGMNFIKTTMKENLQSISVDVEEIKKMKDTI
jgi:copper homeostasis protein